MQAFQDVFISYGRADSKAFAAQLNQRLVEQGLTVWFDFDDIPLGVDYQKQIDDGIERADNFLFIISPHSINSPYCGLEVELALKRQKRIIPLLHVERISRETWQERNPNGTEAEWEAYQAAGKHDHFQNMHPTLRKINWIYAREGKDDFDAAIAGLFAIFDRHKEYVHQHTLLLAKALEWERQQKQSRYLLVGEERQQAEAWLKTRFTDAQPPCLPTDLHCEFITESIKNGQNLMTQIFLSYAEEEIAIMEKVRRSLRRECFTVWTNKTDIQTGIDFQEAINQGIEETDNLIFLISSASLRSQYCQQEIDYALKLNKRIIPLLVEPIELEQLPDFLRTLQFIDLTDNTDESDYLADESQLLRILHQDAAYYEEHKILLTKALKWERQQRNSSILLRGYNLQHAEAWLKVAHQRSLHPSLPIHAEFIVASLQQPPGITLDVFISYSPADGDFARKLNDALQLQGKTTWFDQESIASEKDFQKEIYHGIENSNHVLFVISPNSMRSPYCMNEIEYAHRLNKRIITALHRPVNLTDLHPVLAAAQGIDFNQRDGDFTVNFKELLQTIDTDPVHLRAHTRLLVKAIEWNDTGRKESLLLWGDELASAEQWLAQSADKDPKPTDLQHTYVANSRSAEDANQQATQILQAAAAKGKLLIRAGAIAGGIGLLVAGIASWQAWRATQEVNVAETKVKSATVRAKTAEATDKLLNRRKLEGLFSALEAGQSLRSQIDRNSPEWNNLQPRVMAVLQQAMNGISEKNIFNGHEADVTSVRYSPDGKTIASASSDDTIKLWDVATGKQLNTLKGHTDTVISIGFSPDGETLASGSYDDTIKLWDVPNKRELATLKGHKADVNSISFSPDGQTIASGSDDKTIKLWDVKTGRELQSFKRHSSAVYSVSFSPNGNTIASGSDDTTIKLWDVATGTELKSLEGHSDKVRAVSFSPDGQTIASGSDDTTIKLWDVKIGTELKSLEGHYGTVYAVSFSPNGNTIASGSYDDTIKLWDVKTGTESTSFYGHRNSVFDVSFSPDGQTIVSGSEDNSIKLWQVKPATLFIKLGQHNQLVTNIIYSPDGKTVASASEDNTVKLWNVKARKLLHTLKGHTDTVWDISYSPDSKTLASASEDKTIKLWNVTTGQLLNTLKGHTDRVYTVTHSPDGKMIASGGNDKTVKLWDATTGKELYTLKGHTDKVWYVAFSPDSKILASGSEDKTIKLWETATGKLIKSLDKHQNGVFSIAFSPDGKLLASGSRGKVIRLWDGVTYEEKKVLNGHLNSVAMISFSPDNKTILSGSFDRTIKLWDAATGEEINTINGHEDGVSGVSFSPDGKLIASGSYDKTIRLWEWEFDRLMTIGCNWMQSYLQAHPNESHLCQGYPANNQNLK